MNKRHTIQRCLDRATQVSQKDRFTTGEIVRELQPIIDMHDERLDNQEQQSPPPKPPQDIFDFFNKNIYGGK